VVASLQRQFNSLTGYGFDHSIEHSL